MTHLSTAKKIMAIAALSLAGALTASADTIWNYQGNPMNGCSCSLTGSVVLPSNDNQPIVTPTSWDFTDGTSHLTNLNSTGYFYTPLFANSPLFSTWTVILTGFGDMLGVDAWSQFYGSAHEATDSFGSFGESGAHGIWSDPPVSTPEPSTRYLLAGGLFGLGLGYFFGVWFAALALKRLV